VDPNERRVEHYRRLSDEQWLITDVTNGSIRFESFEGQVSLADVYAKTGDLPLDRPEARGS
jgi:hypothetical protein